VRALHCRHLRRRSAGDPHAGGSLKHQLQRHLSALLRQSWAGAGGLRGVSWRGGGWVRGGRACGVCLSPNCAF
jgi:hypothetical protein